MPGSQASKETGRFEVQPVDDLEEPIHDEGHLLFPPHFPAPPETNLQPL